MVGELLRIIQRSGISPAIVCEGYPSQSFSIHQRVPANKSTRTNYLLCAVFQPDSAAQSLWMYNSAKKTHYSDDLLCSLVVCCVLLSVWTSNRYTISLDQNPFIPFTPITQPPPHYSFFS